MGSDGGEGVLTEDNVLPQNPSEVADDLAATQTLPTETPAALREDQIQNAVSFLNHPKVRGSTKESKVSFLEKKGLTGAEIEEAFKRAPDSGAGALGGEKQVQASAPTSRPYAVAEQAKQTLSAIQPSQLAQQQLQQHPQAVRWTQVVIGASVVAAGAYALKQLVGPYAARAYRRLYGIDESPEQAKQRDEDRRTADLVAAAIQSQTSELKATVESLKGMVADLSKSAEAATPPLDVGISVSDLRAELHAFASTLGEFDGRDAADGDAGLKDELRELKTFLKEHLSERLPDRLQATAPTVTQAPSSPRRSSGPNGMVSTQQVVSPPASRAPHMQERKPEEASTQPPHPPSYMEVLEMLERGETPPNVRSDINDQPPNPSQPPPSTRTQPRAKPWERSQTASPSPSALNGDASPLEAGKQAGSSSTTGKADVWRPPPIPKTSLKRPGSSASSAAGEE